MVDSIEGRLRDELTALQVPGLDGIEGGDLQGVVDMTVAVMRAMAMAYLDVTRSMAEAIGMDVMPGSDPLVKYAQGLRGTEDQEKKTRGVVVEDLRYRGGDAHTRAAHDAMMRDAMGSMNRADRRRIQKRNNSR